MKHILFFALFFTSGSLVSAKELQSCSKYAEVSCAGQQSFGWGCKPGAEACSPIKSGDCTCGSGAALQSGGGITKKRR